MAVVDRGVEHINAGTHGKGNCFDVSRIGFVDGLAEVGAETDRGQPQLAGGWHILGMAKKVRLGQWGKAFPIPRGALGGGEPGNHRQQCSSAANRKNDKEVRNGDLTALTLTTTNNAGNRVAGSRLTKAP